MTKLFLFSFHAFLLWNIWTTYWITNTAYAAGVIANVANAFLMTIPFIVFHYLKYRLGEKWGIVAFLACWITFEFLHMRWELYWPWLTLGNGLAMFAPLIQWYEYSGVLGGSAWILAVNFGLFIIVKNWGDFSIKPVLWTGGCLIFPAVYSLILYNNIQEKGEKIEVVIVQPNYEPHYEKFQVPVSTQLSQFVQLSKENLNENTDYLIFPETSFNQIDLTNFRNSELYMGLRSIQEEFPELRIVVGLGGYRILSDSIEFDLPTTRTYSDTNGEPVYFEGYNCAVQIDRSGEVQEYYKALFVPGAEFFPFRKALFFMKPIIDQLGGTLEGYRTRSSQALFLSHEANVAPAICYESIFGEFISRFVRKGADVIFIMTNDGWWDNTAGHLQHAYYGRLRSIEMRRSIARSANMGVCYFTNQRGDILQPTTYGNPGSITGTLQLNQEKTFYSFWGDIVGRFALFITLLLAVAALVRVIMPRVKV